MEKVPIRLGRLRTSVRETAPRAAPSADIRVLDAASDRDGAAQLRAASAGRVCRVCTAHEARYTCPRCNLPYCSVGCYRSHGESCTEQFYQAHVSDEMAFSERATAAVDPKVQRKRETEQLLARVKQFHDETERAFDDQETAASSGGGEDEADSVALSAERLAQLALLGDDELSLESLTESERSKFLADLAHGRMSKFVVPWEPWWRMDAKVYEMETSARRRKLIIEVVNDGDVTLVHSDDGAEENEEEEEQVAAIEAARFPSAIFTRDVERYLPASVASLVRGAAVSPSLPFHLVELLFAYAFTLRTFNGDWAQDPEDAALTVLHCSDVLREDARFATLEEVVIKSLELRDVDGAPQTATNRLVLDDAAHIVAFDLFALDALTDLCGILGNAADEITRTRLTEESKSTRRKTARKQDRGAVRTLLAAQKKVEFYRVWRFHVGGDACGEVAASLRGMLDSLERA